MQHLSEALFLTMRQRLVVGCLSRFGAVYQGVVTARRVSVVCMRVNVIAIRCSFGGCGEAHQLDPRSRSNLDEAAERCFSMGVFRATGGL